MFTTMLLDLGAVSEDKCDDMQDDGKPLKSMKQKKSDHIKEINMISGK